MQCRRKGVSSASGVAVVLFEVLRHRTSHPALSAGESLSRYVEVANLDTISIWIIHEELNNLRSRHDIHCVADAVCCEAPLGRFNVLHCQGQVMAAADEPLRRSAAST